MSPGEASRGAALPGRRFGLRRNDSPDIVIPVDCAETLFTGHALAQMFARTISPGEALEVLAIGERIADYPDDRPHPSCLLLGIVRGRALHVVVARDSGSGRCFVVTAYEPDPEKWEAGFRKRRRR